MTARELLEKIQSVIKERGEDFQIEMLEGDCFGGDRYGVGVGLVMADQTDISAFMSADTRSMQKEICAEKMTVLMTGYFGGESPMW